MDIRLAEEKDLDQMMEIIRETVKEMHKNDNFQWDSEYPNREVFLNDIKNKSLYVVVEDDIVGGFAVFNFEYPDSYSALPWKSKNKDYVIHRLAVDVNQRKNGIAKLLMEFGEKLALEENMVYIKTDTNSKNIKARKFFENMGYEYIGKMHLPGIEDEFYCYEKELNK